MRIAHGHVTRALCLTMMSLFVLCGPGMAEKSIPEADALNARALKLNDTGNHAEAIRIEKIALEMYRTRFGLEHRFTATALCNLAKFYTDNTEFEKALPLFEQSLSINEAVLGREHIDTARVLSFMADYYADIFLYDKALYYAEKALLIRKKHLGELHDDVSYSHDLLAHVLEESGKFSQAREEYEKALSVTERMHGRESSRTITCLNNMAQCYGYTGDYDTSLNIYERALRTAEIIHGHETVNVANILGNMANVYAYLQIYDKAIALNERELAIKEKARGGDHRDLMFALSRLADIYKEMGEFSKSFEYYERNLRILTSRYGAWSIYVTGVFNEMSILYSIVGDYEMAIRFAMHAQQNRELLYGKDSPKTRSKLWLLGNIYLKMKDYQKAALYIEQGDNKFSLVNLYAATGKHEKALAILDEMPVQYNAPLRFRIWHSTQKGVALVGLGRRAEGIEHLARAVEDIEELRTRVVADRKGFFEAGEEIPHIQAYRELIRVLVETPPGDAAVPEACRKYGTTPWDAAFNLSEAIKARVLLESMARTAKEVVFPEIPQDLRERERRLTSQLRQMNSNLEVRYRQDQGASEEMDARRVQLTRELDQLVEELRAKSPRYAILNYPAPVRTRDLPLDQDELLLEYSLGETGTTLFLVGGGGVEKVLHIPVGRAGLEQKVAAFMEPLVQRQGDGFSPAAGKELYDLLLRDAVAYAGMSREMVIVPDGILGVVPFEVLVESVAGEAVRYAGDTRSFRYFQSASVLTFERTMQGKPAPRPLFAIGNPVFSEADARYQAANPGVAANGSAAAGKRSGYRALASNRQWGSVTRQAEGGGDEIRYDPLPETEDEVKSISAILGVTPRPPDVLLNLEASESRLMMTDLGSYRFLHFATHSDLPGKVQGVNEPFILLGQVDKQGTDDGFLTMSKVLGLTLRADMVVLSACVTGRGKVMEGEGVMHFARAFQHAGAKSVLVSLWEVASDATVEFMRVFYGHIKAGDSRSQALRKTRSEIKDRYPNPFFWAPFVLHGEG
ncbi:CHAT domain-containing protein [Desulfovibrio sulfodismutans]|uniref:CHAT domain-containing protein n=1 Tax=Desulfolutivibrio sulfodismutans TaxID=63561 RepID=A0A7K3NGB1_9BACT|nr:CHAT domain-containing tetratricopeptide repeat protein [Desulfolutivibrio sulfodismutans]NDY55222.1 CHAT domain-containing protein [Desulfolutivibrio sulfodismutans]QLA12959.1 CHAT domain-containing protein [Desulfolutivibrio sulfodismutans DSM 3696]